MNTLEAIQFLNQRHVSVLPTPKAKCSDSSSIDLVASPDGTWTGKRPTSAGILLRTLQQRLDAGTLSPQELASRRKQLQDYLERRFEKLEGEEDVAEGLELLYRATRCLGRLGRAVVLSLVDRGDELIRQGRDRLAA